MINGKSVLGIIPARGGSKGLPQKNILPLAGKPLLAWTIDEAKKSKYIDRCIVSTEDYQIAEVAKNYGGEVPFMRPIYLATDTASSESVIMYVIDRLPEKYNIILLLQPTSPLRKTKHIDDALELMEKNHTPTVVSMVKSEHPIEWYVRIGEDLNLSSLSKQLKKGRRRQDFPSLYRINGAIYLADCDYFQQEKTFFTDRTIAFIMPQENSIDIDNKIDFALVEVLKNNL